MRILSIDSSTNNSKQTFGNKNLKKIIQQPIKKEMVASTVAAAALSSSALAGILNKEKEQEIESLVLDCKELLESKGFSSSDIDFYLMNCRKDPLVKKYNKNALELLKLWAENIATLEKGDKFDYIISTCKLINNGFIDSAIDLLKDCVDKKILFTKRYIALSRYKDFNNSDLPKSFMEDFCKNPEYFSSGQDRQVGLELLSGMRYAIWNSDEDYQKFYSSIVKDYNMPSSIVLWLINHTKYVEGSTEKITKLLENENFPNELVFHEKILNPSFMTQVKVRDEFLDDATIKRFNKFSKHIRKNPELYVNTDQVSEQNGYSAHILANNFLYRWGGHIVRLFDTFDDEAIDYLLRLRTNSAIDLMKSYFTLNEDMDLVKMFQNVVTKDNTPLTPKQKIDSINIVNAYRNNYLSLFDLRKILENDKIDYVELSKPIFSKILKEAGMNDNGIEKFDFSKFEDFDITRSHLLLKTLHRDDSGATQDVVWAMFNTDFNEFIHSESNFFDHTKSNIKTKEMFNQNNYNYENWIHPDKNLTMNFVSENVMKEQDLLKPVVKSIESYIESLRSTGAKSFIDKKLSEFIPEGKFEIPQKIREDKVALEQFLNKILSELNPVFTRAIKKVEKISELRSQEENTTFYVSKDSSIKQSSPVALFTLTVFSHLKEALKALQDMKNIKNPQKNANLDLTIKMWDRNPIKDIFHGNYSNCCIAMGDVNGTSMAIYLLNSAFNMMEIVDNATGNIIGNVLCYFVKNQNNEPVFVLDNIEIKPSYKMSEDVEKEFRKSLIDYSKKIAKSVIGDDNFKIYLGTSYNDIDCSDLLEQETKVEFLGDISTDSIYLDGYKGWINREDLNSDLFYYDLTGI